MSRRHGPTGLPLCKAPGDCRTEVQPGVRFCPAHDASGTAADRERRSARAATASAYANRAAAPPPPSDFTARRAWAARWP